MKKAKKYLGFTIFFCMVALIGMSFFGEGAWAASGKPQGTMTWGVHFKLATPWLDPALTDAKHILLHCSMPFTTPS